MWVGKLCGYYNNYNLSYYPWQSGPKPHDDPRKATYLLGICHLASGLLSVYFVGLFKMTGLPPMDGLLTIDKGMLRC